MKFQAYCELPENSQWITQYMYTQKEETGFDPYTLLEAVEEQAESEGILLDNGEDYVEFFAEWYDELNYPESGAV